MSTLTEPENIKKVSKGRLIFEAVLLALVLALVLIIVFKPAFIFGGLGSATVSYSTPSGTLKETVTKGRSVEVKSGPEIDGYTFIGWRDSQGNMEKRSSITAWENTPYTAVYSVAFDADDHMTFLELEDGLFRPEDTLTNGECAVMLYKLMNLGKTGSGEFTDVDKDDACYTAAATLKDLGVLYGSKLHPDEGMTEREFLDVIRCFYPDDFVEENLSFLATDEELSREEASRVMCTLLGRTGDSEQDVSKVGTILDVSLDDPDYWYIAESCIEHTFEPNGTEEKWTSSKAIPEREPGYFFINGVLHLIDENGSPVTDKTVDGLYFDEAGCYTSGDYVLDAMIREVMLDQLGNSGITYKNEESLRTMYRYVVDNFRYRRRNYYDKGETGWAEKEAYTMLTTGKGNCYDYAALFYEFARALGFDAKIYSGTMGPEDDPHAWVEIEFDGETKLFDPEYEYSKGINSPVDMFKRDEIYLGKYHYKK